MFVKGAKFPKGGPNFLRNMAPGEAIFPRKLGPGGPYFGGAKFPGTPALQQLTPVSVATVFFFFNFI